MSDKASDAKTAVKDQSHKTAKAVKKGSSDAKHACGDAADKAKSGAKDAKKKIAG